MTVHVLSHDQKREEQRRAMIDTLEDLLEKVEAGEVTGLAVATVNRVGEPWRKWHGTNKHTLGNSIGQLNHFYIEANGKP